MKKKSSTLIFLLFLTLGASTVNANKKTGDSFTPFKIGGVQTIITPDDVRTMPPKKYPLDLIVGYASRNGIIKENRWYWVTPGNLSYTIDANDIFKKYENSEIYENATGHAIPMQFIQVGEQYLPSLELSYVTLSRNKIDIDNIKNLPQYRSLLEQQDVVYIETKTGQVISRDKAAFSCCYMYIRKIDARLEAVEIIQALSSATEYTYYLSAILKRKTIYRYNYQKGENDNRVKVTTEVYQDNEKFGLVSHTGPTFYNVQDIENTTLMSLFKQNQNLNITN